MARVTLDPMFTSLKGNLGNYVYYARYGKVFARTYTKPGNPDSAGQRKNRGLFREAMKSWQQLTDDEKYTWNRKARKLPMTGHNLYISQYMKKHNTEEKAAVSLTDRNKYIHNSEYIPPFKMKTSDCVTAPSMIKNCFYPSLSRTQNPPG